MSRKNRFSGVTRRDFLATTTAAALAATLPAQSQSPSPSPSPAPTSWTRVSLTDPQAPKMLASYATAIKALLQLSPTDARNFYRNAFIHTLDCPHTNWWFLPWHRGYLGWWEQTVRQYSGDNTFAFPYWDWTAQPYVPDGFWQGVLNPSDPAYISSYSTFQQTFSAAITQFYAGLSQAQQQQLSARGMSTVASFWEQAQSDWPSGGARALTQQNANLPNPAVVSLRTINAALATPFFAGGQGDSRGRRGGFGSDYATQHSGSGVEGILESQPHDNVHGDVGGFMGAFLSPVDPIFMAHHANIDRLWTVWTARQQAAGLPTVPTANLTQWQNEPFLFYINSQGQQVTQNTAGAYVTVGSFNYNYTQGSPFPPQTSSAADQGQDSSSVRRVTGTVREASVNFSAPAVARVMLPAGTLGDVSPAAGGRRLRAHITLEEPEDPRGIRFHVLVNPPQNEVAIDATHPSYAGTIQFFGRMRHRHPRTFTVPLEHTVQHLRATGSAAGESAVDIHIVPQSRGIALRALPRTRLVSLEVTSF